MSDTDESCLEGIAHCVLTVPNTAGEDEQRPRPSRSSCRASGAPPAPAGESQQRGARRPRCRGSAARPGRDRAAPRATRRPPWRPLSPRAPTSDHRREVRARERMHAVDPADGRHPRQPAAAVDRLRSSARTKSARAEGRAGERGGAATRLRATATSPRPTARKTSRATARHQREPQRRGPREVVAGDADRDRPRRHGGEQHDPRDRRDRASWFVSPLARVTGPAKYRSERPASSSPRRTFVASNSPHTAPMTAKDVAQRHAGEPRDGVEAARRAEDRTDALVGAERLDDVRAVARLRVRRGVAVGRHPHEHAEDAAPDDGAAPLLAVDQIARSRAALPSLSRRSARGTVPRATARG